MKKHFHYENIIYSLEMVLSGLTINNYYSPTTNSVLNPRPTLCSKPWDMLSSPQQEYAMNPQKLLMTYPLS